MLRLTKRNERDLEDGKVCVLEYVAETRSEGNPADADLCFGCWVTSGHAQKRVSCLTLTSRRSTWNTNYLHTFSLSSPSLCRCPRSVRNNNDDGWPTSTGGGFQPAARRRPPRTQELESACVRVRNPHQDLPEHRVGHRPRVQALHEQPGHAQEDRHGCKRRRTGEGRRGCGGIREIRRRNGGEDARGGCACVGRQMFGVDSSWDEEPGDRARSAIRRSRERRRWRCGMLYISQPAFGIAEYANPSSRMTYFQGLARNNQRRLQDVSWR